MQNETNGELPIGNISENNIELTTDIVSAYVKNNTVTVTDLPKLIEDVSNAVCKAAHNESTAIRSDLVPAVTVKKSVTPDFLICLEDGKKFKSLKRHIRTHFNLTPDQYREKWGLPHSYPMVAPNYAATRSSLAKKMGLGQRK